MSKSDRSVIALVLSGNVLDYYDFMLFAHLGAGLTKHFFPGLDSAQAHLLSLFLTTIPFFVRPIGGYIFGRLSDLSGRGQALGSTLKYASIASLGLAVLPGYETAGLMSTGLLILFRALQGLSIGGEYTTAGTLLMEKYSNRRCFLSGILGSSGTVGSLIAFGFSWVYLNDYLPDYAWRWGFALGGLATYLSYYFREKLKKSMQGHEPIASPVNSISYSKALFITGLIGLYIGILYWSPIIYSNYYLTKILGYPASMGLTASLLALLTSIIATPILGQIIDHFKWRPEAAMSLGALLSVPLFLCGYLLISEGILFGQIVMVSAAVAFGAPIHPVVNSLFERKIRSRSINTSFMTGGCIGALAHPISGWLASACDIPQAPLLIVLTVGCLTTVVFVSSFMRSTR